MKKLPVFWRLPWRDRWLCLQVCVLMPIVAGLLATVNFHVLQRFLIKLSPNATSEVSSSQLMVARQVAYIVNRVGAQLFPEGNCLKRSMTLCFLLMRRGIVSELRIGVRRQNGEFQAHAWVECVGEILNDSLDIRTAFSTFEADFSKPISSSLSNVA